MKRKIGLTAILVLASSFALCLTACNGKGSDAKKITDTVVIGTTQSIEEAVRDEYNFDVLASGVSEMPLVARGTDGNFYPLVASYQTEDFLTWTYTVTKGLKWSDGTEVTAEDIVFSLEYEGELERQKVFSETDAAAVYDKYILSDDKKSVSLVLKTANVKALNAMATFRIRPKHIYADRRVADLSDAEKRITCGPFKLEEYNKEANTLSFVKNEYCPFSVNIKRVIYRLFKDAEVMYTAFIQGELDCVWGYSSSVPADYQKLLGDTGRIKLASVAHESCPAMLVLNNKTGFFADKNIRNAVLYALDYGMFKNYFGGAHAKNPNKSFVTDSHIGYKDTETLNKDTTKASKYMIDAGYSKSGGRWVKDGKIAEFTLTVNAGSKNPHTSYAEFVKTQLEEFGIKVNLDAIDSASYNKKTSNKFGEGTISMEAAIYGFTAYGMDMLGVNYINGKNPVQGGAQVFSEELDEIEAGLKNAKGTEEYIAAAHRLQDFYAEEIPAIALFWDSAVYAYSDRLDGVITDVTFGINNVRSLCAVTKVNYENE